MSKSRCGPNWMPEWLRRIGSCKFNASCRVHDMDYATHKYSRDEADERFLQNMLKQADGSIFWSGIAYLYYWLARFAGKLSWGKDAETKD